MPLRFDLHPRDDPRDGAALVTFSKLKAGEYRREWQGTGAGRIVIRADDPEAQHLDPRGNQYVRVYDTDVSTTVPIGGFWTDPFELKAITEKGERELTIGGPGTLAYLDRAALWSHSYIGDDPFDDQWRFHNAGTGTTLGAMFARAVNECLSTQADDPGDQPDSPHPNDDDRTVYPLPDLTIDFDYSTDSASVAWPAFDNEFVGRVGESLLSIAQRMMALGLVVEMDPDTFVLSAYVSKGDDLTGAAWGSGVVRFQVPTDGTTATGNVKADSVRGGQASIRRSSLLVGSQDTYAKADDAGADIPWEGLYNAEPTADATALEAIGLAQLAAREDATDTARLRIAYGNAPSSGRYRPAQHFTTGDTVSIHSGGGSFDWTDAGLLVSGITWKIRKGGDDPDVWVDFGSSYRSFESREFKASGAMPAHTHPPNPRLCEPSLSALALSYASTNGNDLEFGYLGAGGEEVSLWRESVDGGPYPVALPGPTGGEPIWYLRDHTHGCRWTSVDYGPETPSSVFGTHQDHYRRVDNMDGTYSLQWNDGGTSDSGCDTVDGSFVDLRVTYTPGDGDCPEHVGYTCSVGTGTRAARCDHVHAHGLLDEAGTSLHGAHNITYDGSAVGSSADNVQDRLDELASGVSSSISIKHLLTAHPFPICAHRGDIGNDGDSGTSQPENTLEAIRQAVKKGAHLVEFDLYRDSDGVWQLMHDASVTRTTNGTGNVSSKTTAQMAALAIDGGYGYNASRHGTSLAVPTLDSVLDVLRPYDVGVYFHLKETTDAAGTVLAEKIVAEGFVERGIVLCDGGATQAAAVKAVASNLETAVLSGVLTTVEAEPDLDRLLARQDHPTSASVVNGHFPKPTDQYFEVTTHYGTDETSAIENAWTYGVRILMTNNLDTALRARERIVERSATLDAGGTVPIAQLPTGTTSSTVALGNHTHGAAGLVYLPLTTVVGGVPELVWDADDSLIPTGSTPS